MKKSGSITVFTSLFLAVFLLVFQVLLQSVQIGGGRVQAETGVEEGLYSVFAGYDRELLERYHVFMVDGSYGTGVWKPECMYQTVKKCMEESCRPDGAISGVRGENLWKCSSVSGAITAYTLMSDEHGRGYRAQAVDYMKETLGIQGIQLLMKKYEQQKDIFEQQEKRGSDIDVKQSMDSYEKARKEAGQNQGQDPDNTGQQPAVVQVPADFVNPLDVIRQLQKKSILALVVPAGKELSQKGLPKEKRLSRREKQTGMGIPFYGAQEDTVLTRGIFQSYMMQQTMKKTWYMDELITRHGAIMDKYDPKKEVGMIVDEWGTWFEVEPGTNPGFLYQQNTMRDALVAGINLNIFNKHSDRVKMANIAQMINVLQAVILTEGSKMIKTPTYHVFDMYKYHQDADLLDSTLETETVGLEEENMVPNLSESVSIDADGVMHITMTNLALEHAYPIETTILGKKVESIKAQIVTQEMHAKNTFEDPENVTVQSFEGVEKVHAGIKFTIPACSVLHIALK